TIALLLYRLLLPLLLVAALPGWLLRMFQRGGLGTRLLERFAIHTEAAEFEPCGAVHVHAVSVGETLIALKLIRSWLAADPQQTFVLATGTATGHHVASAAGIAGMRVTYAPIDLAWMVRRYLTRFEPKAMVLIEGELWPNLLQQCARRRIPISLINARLSPRSARRYRRCAAWLQPLFAHLDAVGVQENADAAIWSELGVPASRIHHTGSLKFDPNSGETPCTRPEFAAMIEALRPHRGVILAASTHAGEEVWLAQILREAAHDALLLIAPRHAERRDEVLAQLQAAGIPALLRSRFEADQLTSPGAVLIIDSTGELRDWTAHADAVVIGKSFLSTGGQNPAEAIQAGKPVLFGPHMENFQPLANQLVASGGALLAHDARSLGLAIQRALDPAQAQDISQRARQVLEAHQGATQRTVKLIRSLKKA
ncbi:MAG TPA: 3-deoxy-D-manno-octulosonic acid transferase, partial [Luteolibacter sp.]|nr:3-deoxy-D-manno-octulosonic acid transferase [Luteolibacter sp.]